MTAIWNREMRSYLVSPLFYGMAAAFYLLGGYFFSVNLLGSQTASMAWYFGDAAVLLLFIAPVLTMRLFAEERARGTDELLFTLPVPGWKVVLGKYLSALAAFGLMIAGSLLYVLIVAGVGEPRWGEILASYVGLALLGGLFLAAGCLTSSLTSSPLLAGVGGFALLLLLWLAGWGADVLQGTPSEVMRTLSVATRYQDFLQGVIDTSHVVFFLTLTAAALVLTAVVLERRGVR